MATWPSRCLYAPYTPLWAALLFQIECGIPFDFIHMHIYQVSKRADGTVDMRKLMDVRYVPLVPGLQGERRRASGVA